jgi:tRNA threonylcarbamoyladenosine biosynthesis protein TsaB
VGVAAGEAILAIDTSTESAGIAVLAEETVAALRWSSGREQTTSVLDQIDRCLGLAHLEPGKLTGIAVAIGPGMFNGLRVGISLAKGFALSLGVPIAGISTLELTAAPWHGLGWDVLPVVAAGRGRVVCALGADEPQNLTGDELVELVRERGRTLVVGEVPDDRIGELEALGAVVLAGERGSRRPALLAEMARERFRRGDADDLIALEPRYIHGRSAVTPR